jgi:hypothetical protein
MRMPSSDQRTEARRWVKFPATVLFATGILWLLDTYFSSFEGGFGPVGQRAETLFGVLYILLIYVVIPLGSVAVGLGMLSLHRWALSTGFIMPLVPLLIVTVDKVQRIAGKFTEYHASGSVRSFGGGVMTALLLVALWAAYGLVVLYIVKSWRLLSAAREWLRLPAGAGAAQAGVQPVTSDPAKAEGGDFCLLMPEGETEETA